MPRQARQGAPAVLNHLMGGGIERRRTFLGDQNYLFYLGKGNLRYPHNGAHDATSP